MGFWVFLVPSWVRNWLSLTFMPRSTATRLVLDAPSGFDFGSCQVRRMSPEGHYDRMQGEQLHAPGDVTCVADVWPCLHQVPRRFLDLG